jgi:pimeloyl-ACP methyl ester carboxylesterase
VAVALLVPLTLAAACSSSAPSAHPSVASDTSVASDASGTASSSASITESSVAVAGVTLHVRSVGPRTAVDTIITVHGGPGLSLEAMAPYNALAGTSRRVVGYDQRGSGKSTAPQDGDYTLAAQVADLEAVRAATGAATVTLIGESWGGAVAEAYTAVHPEHVRALVIVGGLPLDREAFLAGQARFKARITELQAAHLIPSPLPAVVSNSCRGQLVAELPAYVSDPRAVRSIDPGTCTASTSRATYTALLADQSLPTLATKLGAFHGPALVAMGEHDAFGLEWLDRNVALLSGARATRLVVPSAGHLVALEQPRELLARIDALLAG